MFPVAVLPGSSTFEMQVTSGKFQPEMFAMTNAVSASNIVAGAQVPMAERLNVTAADKKTITLSNVADKDDAGEYILSIRGLKLTTDYTIGADGKTITFTADQEPTTAIEVNYYYTDTTGETIKINNLDAAIGEAIMVYPVYGDGTDCTESAVIGNAIVHVYKARVSQQPGMDGSYKSASTFAFTLSALDAKRADGAAYDIAYVKKDGGYIK